MGATKRSKFVVSRGLRNPGDVDAALLRAFIYHLKDVGLAPTSIRRQISATRMYFRFLAGEGHIKEKISEMIIHATVVRACLEAAMSHSSSGVFGAMFPNELYTNAGKYTGAASYNLMVRHLHDIAGGAVLTAPTLADLENPDTGKYVEKYFRTKVGVDADYRMRLFHAIRDLTADSYGGWQLVTTIQAGGGLYAQRIVTRKHYDLDGAKRAALAIAGLTEDDQL